MKRYLLWLAGCLVLFMQYTSSALAGPLTEQQVESYLNSMPQALELSEKHDDGKRKNIDPHHPLTSAVELMNGTGPAYKDLGKLAAEYGFSSTEEWADVGDRVMNGYFVLRSTMAPKQIDEGYQQGVTNIKNDTKLTDAQKQKILKNMEKSITGHRSRRMSAQPDLPALTPYKDRLEKVYAQ